MKRNVWIFYLRYNDDSLEVDKNDIYAYTLDKSMAYKFIESRDMNKFYLKKMKIDNQELSELYYNYMKNDLMIVDYNILIKDEYKKSKIKMVVTRNEMLRVNQVSSVYLHEYIYREVWYDNNVFKDKYINAMNTLFYSIFHSYLSGGDEHTDKWMECIQPNQIDILLKEYGALFKNN